MDRHLVAYLLLAVLLIAVAALVARARYNSPHRVYRRERHAAAAKWAARKGPRD
jgi:hypothetical protein